MRWLFEKELALNSLNVDEAVEKAEEIIGNRESRVAEEQRRRATKVFGELGFPLEVVTSWILDAANGERP